METAVLTKITPSIRLANAVIFALETGRKPSLSGNKEERSLATNMYRVTRGNQDHKDLLDLAVQEFTERDKAHWGNGELDLAKKFIFGNMSRIAEAQNQLAEETYQMEEHGIPLLREAINRVYLLTNELNAMFPFGTTRKLRGMKNLLHKLSQSDKWSDITLRDLKVAFETGGWEKHGGGVWINEKMQAALSRPAARAHSGLPKVVKVKEIKSKPVPEVVDYTQHVFEILGNIRDLRGLTNVTKGASVEVGKTHMDEALKVMGNPTRINTQEGDEVIDHVYSTLGFMLTYDIDTHILRGVTLRNM